MFRFQLKHVLVPKTFRSFSTPSHLHQKVLAVLYKGGKYAERQSKMLGTVERKLGIEEWLKKQGHELVVSEIVVVDYIVL